MKRQILSLVAAVLTTLSLSAQVSEGHVKYSIEMTSDNPEMAMGIAMMQGSTMDIFFKDDKSRTEMAMGSLMTTTIISDATKKETLTLMSGMMGNTAVRSTYEDSQEAQDEPSDDFEVTVTDETKDILGYTCKKAIVTDSEGNESVFWVTDKVSINKEGQTMLNKKIPGFPLAMEVLTNDMLMTMTALEFNKKIKDKSLFELKIPEGYTETTTEELMNSFEEQE